MPMNRSLYPKNWNAIAFAIKQRSGWQCDECGRICKPPGIAWEDFEIYLANKEIIYQDLYDIEIDEFGDMEPVPKFGRFVLTVAHLNHDPGDNRPENLRALCSVCHLRYDAIHHAKSRRRNRKHQLEVNGQLSLGI